MPSTKRKANDLGDAVKDIASASRNAELAKQELHAVVKRHKAAILAALSALDTKAHGTAKSKTSTGEYGGWRVAVGCGGWGGRCLPRGLPVILRPPPLRLDISKA